jgi:dihydroorotase
MERIFITNGKLVNEGRVFDGALLIEGDTITKVYEIGDATDESSADRIIDAKGAFVLPGCINTQVHFRDFGAHETKATILTESKAALAGGVTTVFMMGNTNPPLLDQETLGGYNDLAKRDSSVNYSVYVLANGRNNEELKKLDPTQNCGIKAFMGTSTGGFTAPFEALRSILRTATDKKMPTAIHSEYDPIIEENTKLYTELFGVKNKEHWFHSRLRNHAACLESTRRVLEAAEEENALVHVLHLTTAEEVELFRRKIASDERYKNREITCEVCVHHALLNDTAFLEKGGFVVCNPAIKSELDRREIIKGLADGTIYVGADDHAPHELEYKNGDYPAPGGLPLVQHSYPLALKHYTEEGMDIRRVVELTAHSPAKRFQIKDRGYLREGMKADISIVDLETTHEVKREDVLYKCGYSPFEGWKMPTVVYTIVNGEIGYENEERKALGKVNEIRGKRVEFER